LHLLYVEIDALALIVYKINLTKTNSCHFWLHLLMFSGYHMRTLVISLHLCNY